MEPSSYEHPFQARSSSPDISASLFEYASVRAKLPEHVRAPLDVLREEVLAICETHGVNHPTKLGKEGKEPTIETLERVSKLLEDITYIFTHRDLPSSKKEQEHIDDQEYVMPFDPESKNLADLTSSLSFHVDKGRFYFIEERHRSVRLTTYEGERHVFPRNIFCNDFTYLGPKLVIIADESRRSGGEFLMDLEGERLDPPGAFTRHQCKDGHLTAIGRLSEKVFHPVTEDGTIHEDVVFRQEVDSHIIAGRFYFVTKEFPQKIYTSGGEPVGNPRGYNHRLFLCEKDGHPTIVTKDAGNQGWWIYDEKGDPIKEIKIDARIYDVAAVNGKYFFATEKFFEHCLTDEDGFIITKLPRQTTIEKLIPSRDRLTLLVRETIQDPYSTDQIEEAYYDQDGNVIAQYPEYASTQPPIFIGENCIFIYQEDPIAESDAIIYLKTSSDPLEIASFKKVYALEAIDEHRFYIVGIEEKSDGAFQMAKRVYDIRNIL